MNHQLMTIAHQSAPWEWPLPAATAVRMPAASLPRWLLVTAGRVWLTRSGSGPQGDDVWLNAGERHPLPAGSEWVVEGWPEASVELLEAPACVTRVRPSAWTRAFAPVLRAAA